MAVSIVDHGTNNTVIIHPEHQERGDGLIELHGSGNVVSVERPMIFGILNIRVGHGGRVSLGADCSISCVFIDAPRGASVSIGADTWFNGGVAIRADEDRGVTTGRNCLFGDEVRFWSSDMHSIVDAISGRRVNASRDIVIGDNVWIAYRALVLKGSRIGDGAILGAGSVLSGEIPQNCAAGGNPARVLKRGVTWDKQLLPMQAAEPAVVKARPRWSDRLLSRRAATG